MQIKQLLTVVFASGFLCSFVRPAIADLPKGTYLKPSTIYVMGCAQGINQLNQSKGAATVEVRSPSGNPQQIFKNMKSALKTELGGDCGEFGPFCPVKLFKCDTDVSIVQGRDDCPRLNGKRQKQVPTLVYGTAATMVMSKYLAPRQITPRAPGFLMFGFGWNARWPNPVNEAATLQQARSGALRVLRDGVPAFIAQTYNSTNYTQIATEVWFQAYGVYPAGIPNLRQFSRAILVMIANGNIDQKPQLNQLSLPAFKCEPMDCKGPPSGRCIDSGERDEDNCIIYVEPDDKNKICGENKQVCPTGMMLAFDNGTPNGCTVPTEPPAPTSTPEPTKTPEPNATAKPEPTATPTRPAKAG